MICSTMQSFEGGVGTTKKHQETVLNLGIRLGDPYILAHPIYFETWAGTPQCPSSEV